jgi:hypothetical protein
MDGQTIPKKRKPFQVHHRWFLLTIVFVLISVFVEIVSYKHLESFITSLMILFLPSLIHFFVWIKLLEKNKDSKFCDFFDFTMCLSVGSFSFPHLFYHLTESFSSRGLWFAGFSLTIFSILLICSMILCVNFELVQKFDSDEEISNNSNQEPSSINQFFRTNKLRIDIVKYPFWRVLHFFAIFMSITYVFGFLMAFYDYGTNKGFIEGERGFYFEKVTANRSPKINEEKAYDSPTNSNQLFPNTGNENKKFSNSNSGEGETRGKNEEKLTSCFYFNSSKASFDYSISQNTNSNTINISNQDNNQKVLDENQKAFEKVLNELNPTDKDENIKENPFYRIQIHGYADDEKIQSKSYNSNFELSLARIITVQNNIIKKLQKAENKSQIEWLLFPHSNESFAEGCNSEPDNQETIKINPQNKPNTSRAVAVFIQKVNSPYIQKLDTIDDNITKVNKSVIKVDNSISEIQKTLKMPNVKGNEDKEEKKEVLPDKEKLPEVREPTALDYLYLSIGAITTNAAGDIKPATPTARFLISLISLFQIFFLVGFFNTLISLQEKNEAIETKQIKEFIRTEISSLKTELSGKGRTKKEEES